MLRAVPTFRLRNVIEQSAEILAAMPHANVVLTLIMFIAKRRCVKNSLSELQAMDEPLKRLGLGPAEAALVHAIIEKLAPVAQKSKERLAALDAYEEGVGRRLVAINKDALELVRQIEARLSPEQGPPEFVPGDSEELAFSEVS